MRKPDLTTMHFEELWELYEELTRILADRMLEEKRELESRLARLKRVELLGGAASDNPLARTDRAPRRKYPKVLPKYRNPLAPSQTWSGRGKQPRWFVAALETGRRVDDLKIENIEKGARRERVAHSRHG